MFYVAKLILTNKENKYLMLYRSNHPSFPNDPDLPGGIVEEGEVAIDALVREVQEEAGIIIDKKEVKKVHESNNYDHGSTYYLYEARVETNPEITISWEHSHYEWLNLKHFTDTANSAKDKYMRMVYDYLSQKESRV
jgi:8-oxo-dGTP pyrophosphatase MutT (NUDIX family)